MKSNRNPHSGRNAPGYRFRFHVRSIAHNTLFLPLEMKALSEIRNLLAGESPLSVFNRPSIRQAREAFYELRKKYDFPYWAATDYRVRDIHDPDRMVPLRLNLFQSFIIDTFRKRYFDRLPGRYIIAKSFGPCGVSTCVQAYILWLQLKVWHKNSSVTGASESNLIQLKANLCRYLKLSTIPSRKGIFIPEAEHSTYFNPFRNPDALRGIDFAYVHMADMGKWMDPARKTAERAYIASVSGVLQDHYTLIVMEGNIPKESTFSLRQNFKLSTAPHPLSHYSGFSRNPFFLREVVLAADPDRHTPFLFISLNYPRTIGPIQNT